jgi:hypothetical protein
MTLASGAAPAKGTRYCEPVVVMLMQASISSFRAAILFRFGHLISAESFLGFFA